VLTNHWHHVPWWSGGVLQLGWMPKTRRGATRPGPKGRKRHRLARGFRRPTTNSGNRLMGRFQRWLANASAAFYRKGGDR